MKYCIDPVLQQGSWIGGNDIVKLSGGGGGGVMKVGPGCRYFKRKT